MINLVVKAPRNFNLFLVGCQHQTSPQCYNKGIDEFINLVLSSIDGLSIEQNLVIDHGDTIDAIPARDRRFNPKGTSILTPQEQAEIASNKLMPIKKNIEVCIIGNHEKALWDSYNPTKDIASRLNAQYGTGACVIEYRDYKDRLMFKHFARHGRKLISSAAKDKIQREANMKASLKLKLQNKMSDCVLMSRAHIHYMMRVKPTPELCIVSKDNTLSQKYTQASHTSAYIPPDHRWYVSTGSFYLTYAMGDQKESYAEDAEYDPVELGFYIAKIRDGKIQQINKHILGWSNLSLEPPSDEEEDTNAE